MSQRAAAFISVIAVTGIVAGAQDARVQPPAPRQLPPQAQVAQALRDRVQQEGRVRVLVELNVASSPEGELASAADVLQQRERISAARARLLSQLPPAEQRLIHRYETIPFVALDVDRDGLASLERSGSEVVRVVEDAILRPVLADSVPIIQADQAWDVGYDGTGTTIAILDTGVDAAHPFLAGKVIEEACYSTTSSGVSRSTCPGGADEQIGPGAGAPCSMADCVHGTHVAGIAAGNGGPAGVPFSGVAKGANLMAVQVFSEIINALSCGGIAPCAGAYTSDIIAGLERVYAVAALRNVVAVNMSLGGAPSTTPCDSDPKKPMIDNLRSIGVATVIAAGNNGSTTEITAPGCISTAVSVGSTNKADEVSYFSNAASFLSLFAPGEAITSSVPGGGFATFSGTSMATPHVAGTWGILKQAAPSASVGDVLAALRATGKPITDTRPFGTVTIPREQVFQALAALVPVTNPAPTISSLSPTHARANNSFMLTVSGSGFNGLSTIRWNGIDVPSTADGTTSIHALIPASQLPAPGTASVSVFAPEPGGGTTTSLPFTIDPPPTLTISASPVAAGAAETVTLANGVGNQYDWLALAAVGAPETSYLQWTYVGNGVANRTWTVTMPTTAGTYEFRLYLNNGYSRTATSAPVTVDPALNPVPAITSLSPASSPVGGPAFTLTVNGSGFANTSRVRWNGTDRPTSFVSATQLQATIGAADIASLGTAQVVVFTPAPGGGTSAPVPFNVVVGPSIAINPATVSGGGSETMTLTNGLGGAFDWLALAATSAPNTSYLQFIYVGTGVTTRTWTVTMPSTPGTYEFRLFQNNGYTRLATSPPITVTQGPNPVPSIGSLSPAIAVVGSGAFTLTVNGSGFVSSSVVRWNGADRPTTFVSATSLTAAIPAGDIAAAGTASITVFSPTPGGGTSSPVSFSVTPSPVITLSAPTVVGGTNETMTLTNGLGGTFDWLALAATSAPNTSYVQYIYVGTGVTTRTWTVAMPIAGGTYEFRLFQNNGYTRLATSPPITVTPGPNPVPSVTSLSPAGVPVGSAPFTLTVNGAGFTSSSVVRWNGGARPTTFVSATQLQAAIAASDVAAIGSALVSVFSPAPGGGTSGNATFAINPPPSLNVSATSVAANGSVTVTLTYGLGGPFDWIALAATSAPNTSYLQYIYVGSGNTTRTWTVTMPSAPGTYEFRLFLNNGYTRAATSAAVTVTP